MRAGEPQRGSLAFEGVAVGGVQLAATATELVVLGDSVTLADDLHVPVFGGEVVLENAGFADLARSSRPLTAAVGLHRIRLAEVSRTLGLPPLEGDVTGRFPRVLYSNGLLTVDGTGELAVFGGTVTMRDIAGSDLLTRYPHLKFSADWQEIDLALVTRTFDFGTMSGIVEGQLVDCEIFRDVPVRFRGRLRTVPRDGVSQRISLKAVNNIAIVGTGSGLGFLDSGTPPVHRQLRVPGNRYRDGPVAGSLPAPRSRAAGRPGALRQGQVSAAARRRQRPARDDGVVPDHDPAPAQP